MTGMTGWITVWLASVLLAFVNSLAEGRESDSRPDRLLLVAVVGCSPDAIASLGLGSTGAAAALGALTASDDEVAAIEASFAAVGSLTQQVSTLRQKVADDPNDSQARAALVAAESSLAQERAILETRGEQLLAAISTAAGANATAAVRGRASLRKGGPAWLCGLDPQVASAERVVQALRAERRAQRRGESTPVWARQLLATVSAYEGVVLAKLRLDQHEQAAKAVIDSWIAAGSEE